VLGDVLGDAGAALDRPDPQAHLSAFIDNERK
jgi:hypothetical protein